MSLLCFLTVLFAVISWSIWLRISLYRTQSALSIDSSNSKPSPLSMAIQDIVSTAGGVYLSIVMLVSFLRIDTPEKVSIFNIAVDPIALLAIFLAIIQPFVLKFFKKDG